VGVERAVGLEQLGVPVGVDAVAAVHDPDDGPVVVPRGDDGDGRPGGAVPDGVVEQVVEDAFQQAEVREQRREVVGDVDLDADAQGAQRHLEGVQQVDGVEGDLQGADVDAVQVEQVLEGVVEGLGGVLDVADEFGALLGGQVLAALEPGGGGGDDGQRRPQVVAEGGQQRRLDPDVPSQVVGPLGRFGGFGGQVGFGDLGEGDVLDDAVEQQAAVVGLGHVGDRAYPLVAVVAAFVAEQG